MATENQQTIPKENTSEVSSDRQFFAGEVHDELSEREIFAGDEDFYKLLADSGRPAQAAAARQPAAATQPPLVPIRHKRFSTLQKVLAISIVVIVAILLYELLKFPSGPADIARILTAQKTSSPKPPVEDAVQKVPQQIQEPSRTSQVGVGTPPQPLSLKVAETFYLQKDYDKAYATYNQLRQSLPTGAEEELIRDFLQLRMALCMRKSGDIEQANRLFRTVLRSRSPLVRVVASYHLSLTEVQKEQYLKARARAYQTIALIAAVDFDSDWALSLQRDCHFLLAESMTRNVLSLCDVNKDLPEDLWGGPNLSSGSQIDPLTNRNEEQLRSFLNSGSKRLSKGLLGPQIQKFEPAGSSPAPGPPRWSVVCHGASIDELLARFAANADLDIHWAFGRAQTSKDTEDTVRKRPVSLYMPAVTAQQFVTVAAGCAGLLARLDDKGIVNIFNPTDYSSLSEHIAFLSQEAISLWQRFLLTFHGDKRIPNAHFAMGLLQAQRDRVTDAMAEYKLVTNRYAQSSLAPFALLHSSKLKANLYDYFGAREDLKQLVEQYPDTEFSGQACLHLADATMKAGLKTEATRLYRKVYNLGFSSESQAAAALGAGRCFYEQKDYETAAKWLTRYISLARDRPSTDLYSAYLLLGKANLALGKPEQACDALQHALAEQLPKEQYKVEAVSALVNAYMQQKHFVEALDTLENVRSWQFSQKEFTQILLLKASVLRAMGLVDKAIATLADRAQYSPDPQSKAKIFFELTKCYIAKGNLELAHRNLTETLVLAEPGALAHEITLKLADICLKLGQNSQTISICSQLLDSGPSTPIKQKALVLLATAYNRQKNYDWAALALLGQWDRDDSPATTGQSPEGAH